MIGPSLIVITTFVISALADADVLDMSHEDTKSWGTSASIAALLFIFYAIYAAGERNQ